jgi:hypothetical protein
MPRRNTPPPGRRALACTAAALLALALLPARASAWGNEGHDVVAMIAEHNLSDAARARVMSILKKSCGSDAAAKMVCVANWADGSRKTTHKFTYNWHFVDITLKARKYDESRDCNPPDAQQKGRCGIAGLERARRILRGEVNDPRITRAQALMFVIHIVGDLHQPLHTVEELVGGNGYNVKYFDIATDLHKVWDTKLITSEMGNESEEDYAEDLEKEMDAAGLSSFQQGDPVAWLNEAHAAAIDKAYAPLNGGHTIGSKYYKNNLKVVHEQLERAGARLAMILNEDLH